MPKKITLQPGGCYHIFNRGNNRENIFFESDNYRYFLNLYAKYINPIAETYAYALLPNHFHFLLKINDEEHLSEKIWTEHRNKIHQPFSNWFNAYAKATNLAYGRVSSLFEDRFERVKVKSDANFTRLIYYLHANPQKHKYVKDFRTYPHTSYHSLLSDKPTNLARETVLEWFGDKDHFLHCHEVLQEEWFIESGLVGFVDE